MRAIIALVAVMAVVTLLSAGCANNNSTASAPSGMQSTPSMTQAQIDEQTQRSIAFRKMRNSAP
jgi:hypothetical protein